MIAQVRALPAYMQLLLAYALLVPLVRLPLPGGQAAGASDVLAVFAVAVLVTLPRARPSVLVNLLLATALISFATAVVVALRGSGTETLSSFVLLARTIDIFLPFVVVLKAPYMPEVYVRLVLKSFLASGTLSLLVAVALYQSGTALSATAGHSSQTLYYGYGYAHTFRAGGLFGNSTDLGHLGGIVGAVALGYAALYGGRILPCLAVFGLCVYVSFISSSRADLLHLVIASAFLLPVLLTGPRLAFALVLTSVAIVLVIARGHAFSVGYQTSVNLNRLNFFDATSGSTFYNSSSRTDTWTSMLSLIHVNPGTGIGFGGSIKVLGAAGDNSFLTVATDSGLFAAAAYAAFWLLTLGSVLWHAPKNLALVGCAWIVSELAHMLTLDSQRLWSSTPA